MRSSSQPSVSTPLKTVGPTLGSELLLPTERDADKPTRTLKSQRARCLSKMPRRRISPAHTSALVDAVRLSSLLGSCLSLLTFKEMSYAIVNSWSGHACT